MQTEAFVPILTHPDAVADAVLANAVGAALALGATLRAAAIQVDIPTISNAFSRIMLDVPAMIRDAEGRSRANAERALAGLAATAAQAGLAFSSDTLVSEPALTAEVVAEAARYSDVSLACWEPGNDGLRALAEALIFGAGRPVVLVPGAVSPAGFAHVAVAWDGSRVAARALSDARPLLETAARVTVMTVTGEKPLKDPEGARRLADRLSARGVAAEAVSIPAEDCPVGLTLQEYALARGAGLLVMGGYGHSRVRDFVLGGATASVLDDVRLPILLSH